MLEGGIKAAGKTGTTNAYRDAWFVGFTGNYRAGVWFGNDDYAPTNRMTGGSLPAMTWQEIMAYAHQGIEIKPIPGARGAADGARGRGRHPQGHRRRRPTPALLTRRGADVLIRVERLMDDASRALVVRGDPSTAADAPGRAPLRRHWRWLPTRNRPGQSAAIDAPAAGSCYQSGSIAPSSIGSTVRLLFGSVFAFAVAAAIGLGATWIALTRGTAYRRRHDRRLDRLAEERHRRDRPLCARDGGAQRRAAGRLGRRRRVLCAHGRRRPARSTDAATCSSSGITPQARFWTITLYDPEGRLVANSVQRHGFTSQEIIRKSDGSFEIVVGPRARPGNWLPTGGVERYVLVLRLYDTPIGVATRTGRDAPMPSITKRACP